MKAIFLFLGASCSITLSHATGPKEAFSIIDPSGKTIASTADVTCAYLQNDVQDKVTAIFTLNQAAATRVSDMSKNYVGKKFIIAVCRKKINQPKIEGQISGTRIMAIGLTPEEKECLSQGIDLKTKCD